ncbi:MAG: LPS assembly lipoprotein LptE [Paracoccaceae bacterium]|nr:LPS assembly lipoprotein LptE [Paracoccaceae bacterium]
MWLSERLILPVAAGLLLVFCSCGFEPVYGTGATGPGFQGRVHVVPGTDRADFELRERLVERLGPAEESAPYSLEFEMSVTERRLALEREGQFARHSLDGTVTFRVTDRTTGKTVYTATAWSRAAYGATVATYPTRVAARDAELRLARSLADRIVARVELTWGRWSG